MSEVNQTPTTPPAHAHLESGMRKLTAREQRFAHTCHWPGCEKHVPPAMWGCKGHWFSLPKRLRDRIWKTYRPGQEIAKTPSPEYVEAAQEVQRWITEFRAGSNHGAKP